MGHTQAPLLLPGTLRTDVSLYRCSTRSPGHHLNTPCVPPTPPSPLSPSPSLPPVIDNLVKGASGQAIQNMNLLFGLPEETALLQQALFP